MSKAGPNFPIIILARQLVLDDLASVDEEASPQFFADTPVYSFSLPDISTYPEDFKAFLYHDLVDNYTLVSLEQSGLRCTHTHTRRQTCISYQLQTSSLKLTLTLTLTLTLLILTLLTLNPKNCGHPELTRMSTLHS